MTTCAILPSRSCRRQLAITQYFFNADAYFAFVDEVNALGVDIPIVPGIMPINQFQPAGAFSSTPAAQKSCAGCA